MKSGIKTMIESLIIDNKSFIADYSESGNIKEYLEADLLNLGDSAYFWYLTDEEINLWENSEDERIRLLNDINDIVKQYDYSINEFLN